MINSQKFVVVLISVNALIYTHFTHTIYTRVCVCVDKYGKYLFHFCIHVVDFDLSFGWANRKNGNTKFSRTYSV